MEIKNPLNKSFIKEFDDILLRKKNDILPFLKEINGLIDSETSPIILSFINCLLENEVMINQSEKPQFETLIYKIKNNLKNNLSNNLINLISKDEIKYGTDEEENISLFDKLINLIFETLIMKSQNEIINSISNNRETDQNTVLVYLKYMALLEKEQIPLLLNEVACIISEEDLKKVLDYFENKPDYFDIFVLSLKMSNFAMFQGLHELVYTSKKYFKKHLLVELPEIDSSRVFPNIKDYNWELASSLIEKRPESIPYLCDCFRNGLIGCSRGFFIEKILEQDQLFCYYIDDLILTSSEFIELCSRSKAFTRFYFEKINTEEEMAEFCKSFCKKDELFILEFLKTKQNETNFSQFFINICKMMRFSDILKSYVLENFADNQLYFHYLVPYLDIERIEFLLKKYYTKTNSLEVLLRKMCPQDLIIEIAKFKDFDLGCKLLEDCFENVKIEENDWLLSMKYLEQIESLIKFRIYKMILMFRNSLYNQAITCLKRSIQLYNRTNRNLLQDEVALNEIIGFLELINDGLVSVLESLSADEIGNILQKSIIVKNKIKEIVAVAKENDFIKILKSCL